MFKSNSELILLCCLFSLFTHRPGCGSLNTMIFAFSLQFVQFPQSLWLLKRTTQSMPLLSVLTQQQRTSHWLSPRIQTMLLTWGAWIWSWKNGWILKYGSFGFSFKNVTLTILSSYWPVTQQHIEFEFCMSERTPTFTIKVKAPRTFLEIFPPFSILPPPQIWDLEK